MSYKGTDPCIKKAFDDEMLFVLMARDETAPAVIMEWIKMNIGKQPPEKLREAFEAAMKMVETHATINIKKGLFSPSANKLDFSHEFQEAKELRIEKCDDREHAYKLHLPKGTVLFMDLGNGYWSKISDPKSEGYAPIIQVEQAGLGPSNRLALRKYVNPEMENPGYIEYYFSISRSGEIIPQTAPNWLDGPTV